MYQTNLGVVRLYDMGKCSEKLFFLDSITEEKYLNLFNTQGTPVSLNSLHLLTLSLSDSNVCHIDHLKTQQHSLQGKKTK